jgi:hypothetical protein
MVGGSSGKDKIINNSLFCVLCTNHTNEADKGTRDRQSACLIYERISTKFDTSKGHITMLGGSLATTALGVLRLRMGKTSRYGG